MAPSRFVVAILALAIACVHGLTTRKVSAAEGTWGEPDLAAVDKALQTVLHGKHLTAEQRKLAEHVSQDVKKDIAVLVANKGLTKEARRAKVNHAIKELASLQGALEAPLHANKNATAIKMHLAEMEEELAEKKKALAKDLEQMKVLSLEKELAEKRIQLEKLESEKAASEKGKKAADEEASKQNMMKKLLAMAKGLKEKNTPSKSEKATPPAVKAIIAELENHAKAVRGDLAHMDAANKKILADIGGMVKEKLPVKGDNDALTKGQSMLKMLTKKEQRKYQKARAVKQNELNEIEGAIKDIKKGDVKALQKVMAKMQGEIQTAKAKGNFLH